MTTDPLSETEEQTRRRIREDRLRARLDEHQRAARLNEPLRDPVTVAALAELTSDARMKRAQAEVLRIEGAKTFRSQIHKLEAEARKLDEKAEKLRREELEQDRLYGEAKGPILMAKARGETILAADIEIATVARDELGARIIHRRGPNKGMPALVYTKATRAKKFTGIEHAYLSGHLSGVIRAPAEALRDTGVEWGQAYIIVTGSTGRGEGSGGFGPKGPQPRMVEAGEARAIMAGTLKRDNLTLTRMTQREVDLLDDICGRDFVLRDLCPTRGTIPAAQRRLRHALRTALENMRAAKDRGEVGKAGRQVKRAVRVMAGVR